MKMVQARVADPKKVEHFLMKNEAINAEQLLENGFVVEIDDAIKGCFVIEPLDQETYWLRQLYMTQEEILALPLIIESIVQRAQERNIKNIYVHSHQQVVDELLETLEFYPQTAPKPVDKDTFNKGNWWVYAVS